MAVDYTRYLAENVLNERRTVSYRSLSRALKVHSNLAKQMLYEFHSNENRKKPNSVNATYIITGVQNPPDTSATNGSHSKPTDDDDQIMQSSPYISSSMPNQDTVSDSVTTTSIILAREEDFDDAKASFRSISSIYVYSLQPTTLPDLNVLTDVCREIAATSAQEDPLEHGKQWGMIQNKNVKRRTGVVAPPPPPSAPSNATSSKTTVPAKRPLQKDAPSQSKTENIKEEATGFSSKQSSQHSESQSSSKASQVTATSKKGKGSLFSSFAKAKPKQKKEGSGSATPTDSGAEKTDSQLHQVLDDASEEEAEDLFPATGNSTNTSNRESRKEREERLKKMMEDDEEEEEKEPKDDDEEMPDATESAEEPAPIDQPPPKQEEPKEEVTVQGGRRRGRRKVMKKKTVKDDEGYLVTVEEPSWESFSEHEPAPPPKKKPAVSAPKGKAGKPGQGNIMSFFSKK